MQCNGVQEHDHFQGEQPIHTQILPFSMMLHSLPFTTMRLDTTPGLVILNHLEGPAPQYT